jgi:mono/diheme cytochrome c family protein
MKCRSKIFIAGFLLMLAPVSSFAGNANNGGAIFQAKCAACHGKDGNAVLPGAPSFAKGERMEKPNSSLKVSITNGLNTMPPFKGVLSDGQVGDLLAYVRKLKK